MQELSMPEKSFSEPLIVKPGEPQRFRIISDITDPRTILIDGYYGQTALANTEILQILKDVGTEKIVLLDSENLIKGKDVVSRIIDLQNTNEVLGMTNDIPEEKKSRNPYGTIFGKGFNKVFKFLQDPFIVLQGPKEKIRYAFFSDSHYDFISHLWKGIEKKREYFQCNYPNCPFGMERQRFSDFIWSDEYQEFLDNTGAFLHAEDLTVEELLKGTNIHRPTMHLGAERLEFYGRLATLLESMIDSLRLKEFIAKFIVFNKTIIHSKNRVVETIPPIRRSTRDKLYNIYKSDIYNLEKFLNKDLDSWK